MQSIIRTSLLALTVASSASFALDAPVDKQRLLPLEGGRNFRDLGGYPAAGGKQVKWGKLYRSGTLYALTDEDYELLDERDIAVIADLRTNEERAEEPTMWQVDEPEILSWAYGQNANLGEIMKVFAKEGVTAEDVEQVMIKFYRDLPEQQASHYTAIFDELANDNMPLVMHCSAGKDRTGLGIGLILTALGVPREVILRDYAMSEKHQAIPALDGKDYEFDEDSPHAAMASLPKELVAPLMGSNPAYLESAFAAIEAEYPSVLAYIQSELQVTDEELASLRANLLEPAAE